MQERRTDTQPSDGISIKDGSAGPNVWRQSSRFRLIMLDLLACLVFNDTVLNWSEGIKKKIAQGIGRSGSSGFPKILCGDENYPIVSITLFLLLAGLGVFRSPLPIELVLWLPSKNSKALLSPSLSHSIGL